MKFETAYTRKPTSGTIYVDTTKENGHGLMNGSSCWSQNGRISTPLASKAFKNHGRSTTRKKRNKYNADNRELEKGGYRSATSDRTAKFRTTRGYGRTTERVHGKRGTGR